MRKSRLGTVLRVRALQERQALGELARARSARSAAANALAQERSAYAARPLPNGVLTSAHLRALELTGLGAHELVTQAVDGLAECDRAVGAAHDAWALASIRQRSTERLDERQRLEAAAHARAAADRALDELAVLRRGPQAPGGLGRGARR